MNTNIKHLIGKNLVPGVLIICFVLGGTIILIKSHAATPYISLESETGTIAAPAASVSDSTASGGRAISFAAAAPPTSAPTPAPTDLVPLGVAGAWTLKFDDEFNGTSLDTSKWNPMDGGNMNKVTTHAANISVSGGNVILTLASSSSGAEICTCNTTSNYGLPIGGYTEARVYFPGTSGGTQYNWPAWWTSGPSWPAAGENDIVEGYDSNLSAGNYHSPSGANNGPHPSGSWVNSYHVFGLWRKASTAEVYWDGKLVRSYSTNDNGQGQSLIANVGSGNSSAYGTSSQVKIDYIRAWQ